jgi:hypothetical protein
MSRVISPTLEIRATGEGERICCRACGAPLVAAGRPWKPAAKLQEAPMRGQAGTAYGGGSDKVLLRRFSCGGCGALLDSETALPGEPFLEDIVRA